MSNRIRELAEKHAGLVAQSRLLLDNASATEADIAQSDALYDQAIAVKNQIAKLERVLDEEKHLAATRTVVRDAAGVSVDEQVSKRAMEGRLLRAHLSGNSSALTDVERAEYSRRLSNAAIVGAPSLGGFLATPEWQHELLTKLKTFGGVRAVANQITTATGKTMLWPTTDDTMNMGRRVAELGQRNTGPDMVFGNITIGAYMYTSDFLLVSKEMLQDSDFPIENILQTAIATRLARIHNAEFTNGTGVNMPQGVVTASVLGKVGGAGQTTSVATDDLIDVQHSIDLAYRDGAQWMMNDLTKKAFRKLKDTTGKYIWTEGNITAGIPDRLLDATIVTNQDMPQMTAGAKSILFGNFASCYMIRDSLGLSIQKLIEKFADTGAVAYLGEMRTDARLISAATPIAYYQNSLS